MLLDKGADVNAQGGDYGNALQAASAGGHEAVVKLLLDKGADVNALLLAILEEMALTLLALARDCYVSVIRPRLLGFTLSTVVHRCAASMFIQYPL
jgi:hypothetical protein